MTKAERNVMEKLVLWVENHLPRDVDSRANALVAVDAARDLIKDDYRKRRERSGKTR
jgi:hypothetical protein